jgi:hypothetical protein
MVSGPSTIMAIQTASDFSHTRTGQKRGCDPCQRTAIFVVDDQLRADASIGNAAVQIVLPDFLTWIEWRDAPCGVPGQRWGLLLQAIEDEGWPTDARGLLFA